MNIPLLQSKAWQNFQSDLCEKTTYKSEKDYQFLAIHKTTPVGNYLYVPYGPVAKDSKSFNFSLKDLLSIAKKQNAIFLRIEPQNPEFIKNFPKNTKKSKNLNPKDTWILDLSPNLETIIRNFSQGTRTRYNTYSKKGLIVESTRELSQIKHLTNLQNKLFKEKQLNVFGEKYLKTELKQPFATLYLVKYYQKNDQTTDQGNTTTKNRPKDGQVIAASLFFDFEKTRYYMQSAADNEFKKLPATVALLTKAIIDAKEKGLNYFDFWGIAPDDAPKDHPWYGFTEFKKSFGGEARHYAGTYDIILKPFKYKLYQFTRKLNRMLRRVS